MCASRTLAPAQYAEASTSAVVRKPHIRGQRTSRGVSGAWVRCPKVEVSSVSIGNRCPTSDTRGHWWGLGCGSPQGVLGTQSCEIGFVDTVPVRHCEQVGPEVLLPSTKILPIVQVGMVVQLAASAVGL